MKTRFETKQYHPETFEEHYIKTDIPEELVETIKEGLLTMDKNSFSVLGPIIDFDNLNTVCFGVREKYENGDSKKYKVTITLR